jgi:hypothetical protein
MDLLMTGWAGTEHGIMAAHTSPLLEGYAHKHGMGFICVNLQNPSHGPSWMKIPNLYQALNDFERVLWVDADVVVLDDSENIMDGMGDKSQALVCHETECGSVPNCGVWAVSRKMRPALDDIWAIFRWGYAGHPWWEQAAVLTMMGYAVLEGPRTALINKTQLYEDTAFLDPKWNHHHADSNKRPPAFFHATQILDRLNVVRKLCGGENVQA